MRRLPGFTLCSSYFSLSLWLSIWYPYKTMDYAVHIPNLVSYSQLLKKIYSQLLHGIETTLPPFPHHTDQEILNELIGTTQ